MLHFLLAAGVLFPKIIIIILIISTQLKKKSIFLLCRGKKRDQAAKRSWKNNAVLLLIIVYHCSEASLNQMLPKQRSPLLQSVQDYCIPYFDCRR